MALRGGESLRLGRETGLSSRGAKRWLLEAAGPILIVLVTLAVLREYLLGAAAPPWDFWSTYTTTAYSWWDLGSFFSPPEYLPYVFGGFPAYLAVQGSGWFLPVGLASVFGDYTPSTAVIVQLLTVAFGALGAYALARNLGLRRAPATLAGVGYLFSPGFFGSAQHIDILRAWAFFPWLLLALKPPARIRPWFYPLATLLWFQFLVGAYPGTIVAAVYLCSVWTIVMIATSAGRGLVTLVWIALTVIPGVLLALIKWLPFITSASTPPKPGNELEITLGTLSTVVFPFVAANIPNAHMVGIFVASTLLVCAFFVVGMKRLVLAALSLIAASIIFGVDVQSQPWQEQLPLLDTSRFRTADFRMGIVLGIALLGAAGAQTVLLEQPVSRPSSWWRRRVILAGLCIGFVVIAGVSSDLGLTKTIRGLSWLAFGAATIGGAVLLRRLVVNTKWSRDSVWQVLPTVPVAVVLVSTAVLGWDWARSSEDTWRGTLTERELDLWGATAQELIESQAATELLRRPPRSGPGFPVPPPMPGQGSAPTQLFTPVYNSADYSRRPSVGGYANLKGQPIFDQLLMLSRVPEGVPLFEALREPSLAWRVSGTQSTGVTAATCLRTGECLQEGLEVVSWTPQRIEVVIPTDSSPSPQRVVVNELAYPGWQAEICTVEGVCRDGVVPTGPEYLLLAADVQPQDRTLTFTYVTPFMGQAWVAFWIGVLISLGAAAASLVKASQQRSGTAT